MVQLIQRVKLTAWAYHIKLNFYGLNSTKFINLKNKNS